MAKILEALRSIPKILPFLMEIVNWLKTTFGENWEKVLADTTATFKSLNEAKTSEERKAAAQAIQKIFKRLNVFLAFLFLASCSGIPVKKSPELKLDICISDPEISGFHCVVHDLSSFTLPYKDSANYTAFSPEDMEAITKRLVNCEQRSIPGG
jgi:hypothetical protein